MSKEQLNQVHTQFEAAARLYCEKVGLDPDEKFSVPGAKPKIAGVPAPILRVERWRLIAEDLFDLSARLVALRDAKQPPKVVLNG